MSIDHNPYRAVAKRLVGQAWTGLDDDLQDDVIDTISWGEYATAIRVMLRTTTPIDDDLRAAAEAALAAAAADLARPYVP